MVAQFSMVYEPENIAISLFGSIYLSISLFRSSSRDIGGYVWGQTLGCLRV